MDSFLKRLFGGRSDSDKLMLLLKKEEQKRKSENQRWAKDSGVAPEDVEGILSVSKERLSSRFQETLGEEPRLVKYSSKDGTLLHTVCGYIMNEQTVTHAMAEVLTPDANTLLPKSPSTAHYHGMHILQ